MLINVDKILGLFAIVVCYCFLDLRILVRFKRI